MEDLAAALIMLFILSFVAFIVFHKHHGRLERRRLELDVQARILDRIGTGEALTAFLQTEEGKALLRSPDNVEEQRAPFRHRGGIRMSIIGLLTAGVICIGIGAGFFYAAKMLLSEPELIVPAGLGTGVGVGCIVAALIHYALGKAWGMLGRDSEPDRSRTRSF
jgi:hypothetical protein